MKAIQKSVRALASDNRGATAVEYGLIVALIVIAMAGGLSTLGGGATGMWTKIQTEMQKT